MPQLPITVLIAAKNEGVNLQKCLRSVANMQRVIVLDSNSDDDSGSVIAAHGRECVQFIYGGGYPKKRQWAMQSLTIDTPWTMLLDADEEVTPELESEIKNRLSSPDAADAFLITKGFHFMGKKFRFGGFSHAAVVLFKTGAAKFENIETVDSGGLDMEVHERLIVQGKTAVIQSPLVHDDFKNLQAYIDRHNRYSSWEAEIRIQTLEGSSEADNNQIKPSIFGDVQQKRRFLKHLAIRIPCEPWLWFCYHYFFRLGFLEGRRGLIASQIRAQYISNVRAKMFEKRIGNER